MSMNYRSTLNGQSVEPSGQLNSASAASYGLNSMKPTASLMRSTAASQPATPRPSRKSSRDCSELPGARPRGIDHARHTAAAEPTRATRPG